MLSTEEHLQRIGEIRAEASPQSGSKPVIPFTPRAAVAIGIETLSVLRHALTVSQVEDLLNSLAYLYPHSHTPGTNNALHVD